MLASFIVLCAHSLGAVAYSNAYFGGGTGPILLDDLLCTGSETRLIECPRHTSQGIGTFDNCPNGHGDDAGVKCPTRKYNLLVMQMVLHKKKGFSLLKMKINMIFDLNDE